MYKTSNPFIIIVCDAPACSFSMSWNTAFILCRRIGKGKEQQRNSTGKAKESQRKGKGKAKAQQRHNRGKTDETRGEGKEKERKRKGKG